MVDPADMRSASSSTMTVPSTANGIVNHVFYENKMKEHEGTADFKPLECLKDLDNVIKDKRVFKQKCLHKEMIRL